MRYGKFGSKVVDFGGIGWAQVESDSCRKRSGEGSLSMAIRSTTLVPESPRLSFLNASAE